MLRYTLRRLAWLPLILFAVSIIAFVMLRALPGQDPAAAMAGQGATPEQVERIRQDLNLDRPIAEQYIEWVKDAVVLDFGEEFRSDKPIVDEFMRRFPASFQIITMALFFSALFGITFGILSAMFRNTGLDYGVRTFAVAGSSIPDFFLLSLLIIVPSILWHYSMPVGGYRPLWEDPSHNLRLMLPPALILGVGGSAGLMRLTRTTMLEVLRSDYVRTAHAKGLRQRTVIVTHALRNAGTPIATALGTALIAVFGGSVIVERILSIQGVGEWFFTAAFIRDLPVVQFLTVYTACVVVLVNLAVDLSYAYIDPRIRYT
ncbi:MAG: ABC transporter permease [Dehalococcoidia bacterium]